MSEYICDPGYYENLFLIKASAGLRMLLALKTSLYAQTHPKIVCKHGN